MFAVITRSCHAPKSGGGKYRRPVRLLVVDATNGIKPAYRRGDPDVVREWHNVDSRYNGPRSEHGQARREAEALATSLNERHATAAIPSEGERVIFTSEGGFRIESN